MDATAGTWSKLAAPLLTTFITLVISGLLLACYHNAPLPMDQVESNGVRVAAALTVTVFPTVGFGDITAISDSARLVVTVQMVCDIVLVAALAKLVTVTTMRRRLRLAQSINGCDLRMNTFGTETRATIGSHIGSVVTVISPAITASLTPLSTGERAICCRATMNKITEPSPKPG